MNEAEVESRFVGAMTGAIAGAHHGYERIPSRWVDKLENGTKGRDYVIHLAEDLYRAMRELATD